MTPFRDLCRLTYLSNDVVNPRLFVDLPLDDDLDAVELEDVFAVLLPTEYFVKSTDNVMVRK